MELAEGAETQRLINFWDDVLSQIIEYPAEFKPGAQSFVEEEIMQLEAAQLAALEVEKELSRRAGRLSSGQSKVITPIVPQWERLAQS